MAETCVQRTHELVERLEKVPGIKIPWKAPYFHEAVVEIPRAEEVQAKMLAKGFLAGLSLQPIYRDLRDHVLLCCTERITRADVDAFVAALAECMGS